jgi:CBS domain-containing protein
MLDAMEIRELMTASVVTADPATPVREIAALMRERNVGSVVLVRDGAPTGIVTDRDLAVSVLADGRSGEDRAVDHASAPVVTGAPDMDVSAACELLVQHGIRRLPIVDPTSHPPRLTGIVTLDDLAARTGDAELVAALAAQVTRAALPDFYFHQRGG